MRTPTLLAGLALLLAGCGGGGGGNIRSDIPPNDMPPTDGGTSFHLLQRSASQSPIILGRSIGLVREGPGSSEGVQPVARHDTPASHTGWMPVSTGVAENGTTKPKLIDYLSADIAASGGTLKRFVSPPVIHVTAGATGQDLDATMRAVQMINASLPDAWQLSIAPSPKQTSDYLAGPGEILMVFATKDEWEVGCHPDGLACSSVISNSLGAIRSATIFVDPNDQTDPMYATWIAHEMLHALGREHADPQRFPQSLMVPEENLNHSVEILDTLDRDALLAVYGMLDAGDTSNALHTKLGAWQYKSFHVMGGLLFGADLSDVDSSVWFGVADRNGKQFPWVIGTRSATPLAENPQLHGSARWEGRLLGMTPNTRIVAGGASLDIDLSRLSGELAFTGLEQWALGANPGSIGTGIQWGDGDLRYGVQVRGSMFIQTGTGDAGTVTGMFLGPAHDGMGGTLERDGLDAAFGGVRQ